MSRLVVLGATGQTGRLVVERALGDGHSVVAAARRPEDLAELAEAWSDTGALTVAAVDVRDPDAVRGAVAGAEVAISAIASSGRHPHRLFSAGTGAIVDALETEGVPRLLCVSSRGVNHDDRELPLIYRKIIRPWFLDEVYADMAIMERTVRASRLDWILVRPPRLTNGPARGRYRIVDGHNPTGGWILSRADLAAFLVEQVAGSTWLHRTPTLAY